MKSKIKIDYKSKHQIGGKIDDKDFTIKWGKGICIDPESISYKISGTGITYLVISSSSSETKGNPFLPSMTVTMRRGAVYENGEWHTLNSAFVEIATELVKYITRIQSFTLV